MRLVNLFEESKRKEVVIFSGGFQPFLPSHLYCWNYIKEKFPEANCFIASSNNTKVRPFNFKEKQFIAIQAGIPKDKFVEVQKPYSPIEICKNYDPNNTILIFGISEKDGERFGGTSLKNGELKYLLPYPSASTYLESMNKHAYYVIIPKVQTFKVLGNDISSATQIRELYKKSNETDRMSIIRELYPESTKINTIKRIFDRVLLTSEINEIAKIKQKYPSLSTVRRWYGKNKKIIDAYIVGSEAKGTAKYDSDLDIAIIIPPKIGISSLKFSEHWHMNHNRDWWLNWNGRQVDLQFFYPDDPELKEYSKIPLKSSNINESKETILNTTGWITPDDNFIPCGSGSGYIHLKLLSKYGITRYNDAYMLGWIRFSVLQQLSQASIACFETIVPFKRVENRLKKFAKLINNDYSEIYSFCGNGETYEKCDWDGKQFRKMNLNESKLEPCYHCNGEGYIKTGNNKGYFCKYCKGNGQIRIPDVDFKKMSANDLNESPNFNYSQYNNKEDELKNGIFKVHKTYTGYYVKAYSKDRDYLGYIQCVINYKNDTVYVKQSQISEEYKGTGLGQILYDIAIQYAKKIPMSSFMSDITLSSDAHKAWNRLGSRYNVEKVRDEYDPRIVQYKIELYDAHPPKREIINETLDFGYKHINNRDEEISKLVWKVKQAKKKA